MKEEVKMISYRIKTNPNHLRGLVVFNNLLSNIYSHYQRSSWWQKDENPEFVLEMIYTKQLFYFVFSFPEHLKQSVSTQFRSLFEKYGWEEMEVSWRQSWSDKNISLMEMDLDKRDCVPVPSYYDLWNDYKVIADIPSARKQDNF